jgi:hypothetical protein
VVDRGGCIVASVNGVSCFGNEAYPPRESRAVIDPQSGGPIWSTGRPRERRGTQDNRHNDLARATGGRDPDILTRVERWYPLGRIGTASDVSAAVLFLASDHAARIRGVTLPVDGGLLAGNKEMAREIVIGRG